MTQDTAQEFDSSEGLDDGRAELARRGVVRTHVALAVAIAFVSGLVSVAASPWNDVIGTATRPIVSGVLQGWNMMLAFRRYDIAGD